MQDTAVVLAEDAGLQKELLPEAHVAVGKDEREAIALDFVVKLYAIRSSDKRHANPLLLRMFTDRIALSRLAPQRTASCPPTPFRLYSKPQPGSDAVARMVKC